MDHMHKADMNVPRATHTTHTYFVDILGCGISHVKTDILSRYVNFLKSLIESPCMEVLVNIVARDSRTTTKEN